MSTCRGNGSSDRTSLSPGGFFLLKPYSEMEEPGVFHEAGSQSRPG